MAFNAAQALATSLSGNLGRISLAALYSTATIFSIVAPKIVELLGPRLAMVLGGIPYILMILSGLKPEYYTSIPANILVGVGAPLLWTAQGVYLSRCAFFYGQQNQLTNKQSTSHFNGVFWSCFQLNGTAGCIISSLVLTYAANAKEILFIVLGASAGFGIFVISWLKNITPPGEDDDGDVYPPAQDAYGEPIIVSASQAELRPAELPKVTFYQTLSLLADPALSLTLPLIFYNGLSLGFFLGDFTADAAAKALGIGFTGFAAGAFYLSNSIATMLWSKVANSRIGRQGVCVLATIFSVAFWVFMYLWKIPYNFQEVNGDEVKRHDPDMYTYIIIFGGAVVFGIGDAVWESQLPAILQSTYEGAPGDLDASMANCKLWQFLGFASQFALGIFISFKAQVVVLFCFQILGSLSMLVRHLKVESIDDPYADEDGDGFAYKDYDPEDYAENSH